MKVWAAVLTALFVLCAVLTAYFFIGGTLVAESYTQAAPASEYPDAFRTIAQAAAKGEAERTYTNDVPSDPAGCVLTRVVVDLKNVGMFEAGWLEVDTDGCESDVALYEVIGAGGDVPAMGRGSVELRFLSRGTGQRQIRISYYVLGLRRTVTVKARG